MNTISSFNCPFCRHAKTLPIPYVYDDARGVTRVCVITTTWPYDRRVEAEGPHTQVELRDGKIVLDRFLHRCPARSL